MPYRRRNRSLSARASPHPRREDITRSESISPLTLRPHPRPLIGPALRIQDPVLGHPRPIQTQRRRAPGRRRASTASRRARSDTREKISMPSFEVGIRELLGDGRHVDALPLADRRLRVEDHDAQLVTARRGCANAARPGRKPRRAPSTPTARSRPARPTVARPRRRFRAPCTGCRRGWPARPRRDPRSSSPLRERDSAREEPVQHRREQRRVDLVCLPLHRQAPSVGEDVDELLHRVPLSAAGSPRRRSPASGS